MPPGPCEDYQMKRILIVDQDADSSVGLSKTLEKQGFFTQNQSDPERAVEAVGNDPYDLILVGSDWGPKESFSFELTTQLLNSAHGQPEIVLMSHHDQLPIFESHQAGASHVMKKPLNMDVLNELIGRSGSRKEPRRFDRVGLDEVGLGQLFGHVIIDDKRAPVSIEIANIGRGGFFFQAPATAALAVGHVFDFDIKLGMVPDGRIAGKGIVRWTRDHGVGVEFLVLSKEFETMVQSFVDLFKIKEYVPVAHVRA